MSSSCVRQSHPDEVVGEVAAVGVGAGVDMGTSVCSDVAISFQACILTNGSNRSADRPEWQKLVSV